MIKWIKTYIERATLSQTAHLIPRSEILAGADPHLQPAASIIAQLGGSQLLPREAAAHQLQPASGLELHQGDQAAQAFSLLLQHQLGQPLGDVYNVLVVFLNFEF